MALYEKAPAQVVRNRIIRHQQAMDKKSGRTNLIARLASRYVTASNGIYMEPGLRCRCRNAAMVHVYRFEHGNHAKKKCFYMECSSACGLVTCWYESFEAAASAFLQRKCVKCPPIQTRGRGLRRGIAQKLDGRSAFDRRIRDSHEETRRIRGRRKASAVGTVIAHAGMKMKGQRTHG